MLKKTINCCLLVSLMFAMSGCGAIFYSERKGNSSQVDPKVAVLDGIGLIFFIIPGVVAYAIDFATGCIYLSGGGSKYGYNDMEMNDNANSQDQFNKLFLAQNEQYNYGYLDFNNTINPQYK